MSKKRFDQAFTKFLQGGGEKISPKTFFEVLEHIERDRIQRTIKLQAKIVGEEIQFEPSPEVSVHGNEIWLDDRRIVVEVSSRRR